MLYVTHCQACCNSQTCLSDSIFKFFLLFWLMVQVGMLEKVIVLNHSDFASLGGSSFFEDFISQFKHSSGHLNSIF